MRLIAILISLWLNHYSDVAARWERPGFFRAYADAVYRHFPPSRAGDGLGSVLALLLPPVLALGIVQWLADDWLLALIELVLGVWVLVLLHGPGSVDAQVEAFAGHYRQGRMVEARAAVAALTGREESVDSDVVLPGLALEGLFWQSYRRVFSGVFWYLLLGPVGALLLYLAELTRRFALEKADAGEGMRQVADALLYALDWLPARAMALSFGLAGSFVHALDGWRAAQEEPDEGPQGIVVKSGVGALDPEDLSTQPDAVEENLRDARDLVTRTLMVWLAVIALLTITGWLD